MVGREMEGVMKERTLRKVKGLQFWGFERKDNFIVTTLNKKQWLKRKKKNVIAKASRKVNR
jgi:hypothetical protein